MVEDFGSYLKAERELRGVTLEELHAKTKIPIHFLQALERNKFEELPEQVFIKGYIRSFAKVIGANEDEMLSAYIDITKTAPSTDLKSQSIPKQSNPNLESKFVFIVIFTILFLSGAVWGVNTLIRKFNTEPKESTRSISQQKQNKVKEEIKNSPIAKELADNKAPTESRMPLKLKIKTKNDVWLNIAIDDSPIENFVFSKGSEKLFYGKNQYALSVGNQDSVDLTLNGIKLNFPNKDKNDAVKNFIINSKLIE